MFQLKFQSDLEITHMYSGEGEKVKLFLSVWPTGEVEDWLQEVEKSMKATLRENINKSLSVYPEVGGRHGGVSDVLPAFVLTFAFLT